ncbi:hypothetical protein BJV78DRAFT_1241250 [Lactifluus subvellereus]|nr:hypothetical protein BJV78DRAFT_1241250 [Lactifluus subvellereus]
MILAEVHLLESRVYRGIGNLAKAKSSLTSARTAAISIYCPPQLQAALDLQSGILHAEDKDYTMAYSYFYETFENLSSQDGPSALGALKYILLCKVMLNLPEDVNALLSIKLALKYVQLRDVECMRAVARAHHCSRVAFEQTLCDYREELSSDPTIRRQDVEATGLSQMILDKVFHGVLVQGRGCLVVFDEAETDDTYGAAIETLEEVSKVVDSLYAKLVKIA